MTIAPISRYVCEDLEVEFEILPPEKLSDPDPRREAISAAQDELDILLNDNQIKIDELTENIDRLTNHADKIDYAVAIGSGVLTGLIDSFWVGKFNLQRGKWSYKTTNKMVMWWAKKGKRKYTGIRLDGAVENLQRRFKIPSDNIWRGAGIGVNAKSHHIDDFAHHLSPAGLFFSILTQFTKKGYFSNSMGKFCPLPVGQDDVENIWEVTKRWLGHIISDMSGSKKTAGAGMGIPGPIGTLLKEFSALPIVRDSGFPKIINDIFVKEKFDFRSELAIAHELGWQALPVILNEIFVRTFYFIRRFIWEYREKKNFADIDRKKCLPWKNRTIVRMLTVAHGTFVAVDLADAAIRGALASGGNSAMFAKEALLRINIVGVGRFVVAVFTDLSMGLKRARLRNERLMVYGEQQHLMNAKVFYYQAGMWIAAEQTERAIDQAYGMMEQNVLLFISSMKENNDDLNRIEQLIDTAEEKNPGLKEKLLDTLTWE